MNVDVCGRNDPVEPRLRALARRKVQRLERVVSDAWRAEVRFRTEHNPRIAGRHACAITLHLRGASISAHAAAPAPEAALDLVIDKLRHQVGRRKDRRVRRSQSTFRLPRGRVAG